MNNKVVILMATYNGELYLREQIESIINQSHKNWELIISDDCSNDDTINILKQLAESDKRIKYSVNEINLGQVKNFKKLMNYDVKSDYIMFADQDDVWKDNKIERLIISMLKAEKKYGQNELILVYSQLQFVDSKLNCIDNKRIVKKDLLSFNYIWGCSIIINRKLLEKSKNFDLLCQNHDYWIALNAENYGVIISLDEKLTLYRQHIGNVTGGINNYSIIMKFKNFKKTIKNYDTQINQNVRFILSNNLQEKEKYKLYIKALKSDFIIRVIIFMNYLKIRKNSFRETIMYYIYITFIFRLGILEDDI